MPQLTCEVPEDGQVFILPATLLLAEGRADGGTLVQVRVELSDTQAAAGAALPGLSANCKDAYLDETRTVWSVENLGGALHVGDQYVNIWAQFDGGGISWVLSVKIVGMNMDPPPFDVAGLAYGAQAAGLSAEDIPAAFNVRLRRFHIAHLVANNSTPKHLSTLLNSRILQAAPIRLEFDFAQSSASGWRKLIFAALRDAEEPEDPEFSSEWRLELPLPIPEDTSGWIAKVFLERTTATGTAEDFWYHVGFDPAGDQSYTPQAATFGVHILKVSPA